MAMNVHDRNRPRGSRGHSSEAFVLIAIAIVAGTAGLAAFLHLGLGAGAATAVSAVMLAVLVTVHRRRATATRDELPDVLSAGEDLAIARASAPVVVPQVAPVSAPDAAAFARTAANTPAPATLGLSPLQRPSGVNPVVSPATVAEPNDEELGLAALKDYWAYRPVEPRLAPPMPLPMSAPPQPRPMPPARAAAPPPVATPLPPVPRETVEAPASLLEADVEMIQGLIKSMADKVNAAEAGPPPAPTGQRTLAAALGATSGAALGPPNGALPPAMVDAQPLDAVEASLDALRSTADAMRNASARSPAASATRRPMSPPPPPTPSAPASANAPQTAAPPMPAAPPMAPPQVRPGHLHLALIAEAVHSGRVEVLLDPILGLGDLRARHYEVSIRLLDPAGNPLAQGIDRRQLATTGLLPLLDRASVISTAGVASRLDERGKGGAVMTLLSGESLIDERFLGGASEASRTHASAAHRLVLTLSQSDLRMLSEAQRRSLAELTALGFRFALSDVTDLDMDFEALATAGFTFVKLDASVFLEGLQAPHGLIPSADICKYFSSLGYALIVDHIDSEYERSRLFGFGVLFGQGDLFGGARPVKAEALATSRPAAA
ncbi:MAG: EAL domain-containing protein [Hyphomicrobium sp.]